MFFTCTYCINIFKTNDPEIFYKMFNSMINQPIQLPSLIQNFRVIKFLLYACSIHSNFFSSHELVTFLLTYVIQPIIEAVLLQNLGNVYIINTTCGLQCQALFTFALCIFYFGHFFYNPSTDHEEF